VRFLPPVKPEGEKKLRCFQKLPVLGQLFSVFGMRVKGRETMKENSGERSLKSRIREGEIRRRDVTRRLAELAFGKANDCVRLALEEDVRPEELDLSLLTELKRNDKGTLEVRLVDRLKALEQLANFAEKEGTDLESFLKAMQGGEAEG
jgi:hypothetical protein